MRLGRRWAAARELWRLLELDRQRPPHPAEVAALRQVGANDAKSITAWLRSTVPYRPEPVETYRSPLDTLVRGGDCDDSNRLLLRLLRIVGLDASMRWLGDREGPLHPVVVVADRIYDASSVHLPIGVAQGEYLAAIEGATKPAGYGDAWAAALVAEALAELGFEVTERTIQTVCGVSRAEGCMFGFPDRQPHWWGCHNWGSIHHANQTACSPCEPPCGFLSLDGPLNGPKTPVCFRCYPSPKDGAAGLVDVLFGARPSVYEAARSGDTDGVALAMRRTTYFCHVCSNVTEDIIRQDAARYASALQPAIERHAERRGVEVAMHRLGGVGRPASRAGSWWAPPAAVAIGWAAVAGAAVHDSGGWAGL